MQTARILLASLPELWARTTAKSRNWWDLLREKVERCMVADISVEDGFRVGRALFMASVSVARSNPNLSNFYNRLKLQGKFLLSL